MQRVRRLSGPLLLCASALSSCSSDQGERGTNAGSGGAVPTGGSISIPGAGGTPNLNPADGGPSSGGAPTITSIRVEPADAVLDVAPGATGSETYRVFASISGGAEQDITQRSVFDVPDNWLVGTFRDATSPIFTTAAMQPRGGKVTI